MRPRSDTPGGPPRALLDLLEAPRAGSPPDRAVRRALYRSRPLFGLGQLAATPGALTHLAPGVAVIELALAARFAPADQRAELAHALDAALDRDGSILARSLPGALGPKGFHPSWLAQAVATLHDERGLSTYTNRSELAGHALRASGRLWLAALRASGRANERTALLADAADTARVLGRWSERLRAHLHGGQLYLPLEGAGGRVGPEALERRQAPAELQRALAEQRVWIESLLGKARSLEGLAGPPLSWLVRAALARTARRVEALR